MFLRRSANAHTQISKQYAYASLDLVTIGRSYSNIEIDLAHIPACHSRIDRSSMFGNCFLSRFHTLHDLLQGFGNEVF